MEGAKASVRIGVWRNCNRGFKGRKGNRRENEEKTTQELVIRGRGREG